jgi:hypothetical protein
MHTMLVGVMCFVLSVVVTLLVSQSLFTVYPRQRHLAQSKRLRR